MGGERFATYCCYLEVDNTCVPNSAFVSVAAGIMCLRNVYSMKPSQRCTSGKNKTTTYWEKKNRYSHAISVQSHCVHFKARFFFFFLQNMDTVLLREWFCFFTWFSALFVTSCILHYFALFFNSVCKRHASLKTKLTDV